MCTKNRLKAYLIYCVHWDVKYTTGISNLNVSLGAASETLRFSGSIKGLLVHVMACPVGIKVVRKIISASTGLVSTTIFGRVCRFMGYALDSEAFCESR